MTYYLIDDPLCDLDETIECYDNCEECPHFYDCYIVEGDDTNEKKRMEY